MLGNRGPDDLRDGLIVNERYGLQILRLISRQPDSHGLHWFHGWHRDTVKAWLSRTKLAWYLGGSCMEVQSMASAEKPEHQFKIQIDRVHYEVAESEMTGAEIRSVPAPPIGAERDLFEVVPGQPDRKIADGDVVEIRNGKRFFTAPGQINPGNGG